MILGMVPMALGIGEGGEQNAPLGRAVIGGLLFATFATLIFVPTMYRSAAPPTGPPLPYSHPQGSAHATCMTPKIATRLLVERRPLAQ